jgi:transcriptional regulator with XRE-family HTH domain
MEKRLHSLVQVLLVGSVLESYLSAVERGRGEVGAEVLLAISREFGKSLEWLLTGKE